MQPQPDRGCDLTSAFTEPKHGKEALSLPRLRNLYRSCGAICANGSFQHLRRDCVSPRLRGEVWAVDFEPQTHKQEPGKKERPALVIQTDALNRAGHPMTIIIPNVLKKVEEALKNLTGR